MITAKHIIKNYYYTYYFSICSPPSLFSYILSILVNLNQKIIISKIFFRFLFSKSQNIFLGVFTQSQINQKKIIISKQNIFLGV